MPYNGSGVFSRLYSWTSDKNAGINIRADRMDNETDGIATGLSNCVTRDGQSPALANLPMGGYSHTNVGTGTARNQYANMGQAQDDVLNWVAAGGTVDAITATYSPSITALVDGQLCAFRASGANTSTTPTFSPNGLTARTITKQGGSALLAGDIPAANAEVELRYNLANTRWEILNVKPPTVFADNVFRIQDNGDATKQIAFEASGITTATTRTVTMPDANLTMVGTDTAQTLTNKTFAVASNTFSMAPITNSLGADVSLNNTGSYFDGPSIAQGTSGTWFVSGSVNITDTAGAAAYIIKLHDGTTTISSTTETGESANNLRTVTLSGFIQSPAGNLRISVRDTSSTSGKILFNQSGFSKDSTISAIRIA